MWFAIDAPGLESVPLTARGVAEGVRERKFLPETRVRDSNTGREVTAGSFEERLIRIERPVEEDDVPVRMDAAELSQWWLDRTSAVGLLAVASLGTINAVQHLTATESVGQFAGSGRVQWGITYLINWLLTASAAAGVASHKRWGFGLLVGLSVPWAIFAFTRSSPAYAIPAAVVGVYAAVRLAATREKSGGGAERIRTAE